VDGGEAASFSNAGTGRWANCKCAFQHADYSARHYGPARLPLAVLIALIRLPRGTQARPPNTATITAMHVLQRPSDARAAPVRCKRRGLTVTGCRAGAGPGAGAQVRWDYKVDEMEGGRGEAEDVDESLPPSQEPSQAAAAAADSWAAGGGEPEGAGAAGSCPGLSRGSKRIRAGPE